VKKGEFEDWILPGHINDFKKNRKAPWRPTSHAWPGCAERFIAFETGTMRLPRSAGLEQVTKQDVVRVANDTSAAATWRLSRDAQHEVPRSRNRRSMRSD